MKVTVIGVVTDSLLPVGVFPMIAGGIVSMENVTIPFPATILLSISLPAAFAILLTLSLGEIATALIPIMALAPGIKSPSAKVVGPAIEISFGGISVRFTPYAVWVPLFVTFIVKVIASLIL